MIRILLAASVLAATPAAAQDLIAKGRAIAEANCARCHAIGTAGASPFSGAPPFRTLSARYPITDLEEALAEGIVSGHPAMPQFEFAPDDIAALVAYLQSIQSG
jgi:mono/diheme cytochrome c family protein